MNAMTMRLSALLESGHGTVLARYRREDPYAIVLGFDAVQRGLEWTVSRELLSDALVYGHAGVGDIRVTVRGDLVVLGLSTPDGTGTVVFRRNDIDKLLAATYRVVRPGQESAELDWSDLPGVSQ